MASLTKKIADTNDAIRKALPAVSPPHKLLLSHDVSRLDPDEILILLMAVRNFDDFNKGNNPHKERDMGEISLFGDRFFWKFDYYDDEFEGFKEDGNRALMVMRASEY